MATAAAASSSPASPKLQAALRALGKLVVQYPLDEKAIQEAFHELEQIGGQELVVETIGTTMTFLTVSKVVDATGVQASSNTSYAVMNVIAKVASFFN
jgi:hypothetical protein